MPEDKKPRSTYSTAQFIEAYAAWIAQVAASGGINELHKELKSGATSSNPKYTRPEFNKYFVASHNKAMKVAYPDDDTKLIQLDSVDNTKISQIFNYVKTSLVKDGYDKNAILKLPPARVGKTSRDWGDVATMFMMGKKKSTTKG